MPALHCTPVQLSYWDKCDERESWAMLHRQQFWVKMRARGSWWQSRATTFPREVRGATIRETMQYGCGYMLDIRLYRNDSSIILRGIFTRNKYCNIYEGRNWARAKLNYPVMGFGMLTPSEQYNLQIEPEKPNPIHSTNQITKRNAQTDHHTI